LKKYAAEALGAFALVFAGTGAIIIDSITNGSIGHVGISLTFGLVIMVMIYAVGDISGAHFNPAVTFGLFLAGHFPLKSVIPYWISQFVGACLASFILLALFGNHAYLGTCLPSGSDWQSCGLEIILTTFLVFVILCVVTGPKEIGIMAGLAVGGTIALDALFGGPISGASMNPARSLAPALVSGHLAHVWIYIVGPFVGSIIATLCWALARGRGGNPTV
jgi:aquaporin NIP